MSHPQCGMSLGGSSVRGLGRCLFQCIRSSYLVQRQWCYHSFCMYTWFWVGTGPPKLLTCHPGEWWCSRILGIWQKTHLHQPRESHLWSLLGLGSEKPGWEKKKKQQTTGALDTCRETEREETCCIPLPCCGCFLILAWYLSWEKNINVKC